MRSCCLDMVHGMKERSWKTLLGELEVPQLQDELRSEQGLHLAGTGRGTSVTRSKAAGSHISSPRIHLFILIFKVFCALQHAIVFLLCWQSRHRAWELLCFPLFLESISQARDLEPRGRGLLLLSLCCSLPIPASVSPFAPVFPFASRVEDAVAD